MSAISTIPETILIGRTANYKSVVSVGENALYGERVTKQPDPVMIAMITDALAWHYETNPSDSTLRGVANYAIWIYGLFQVQARSGSGGGSVIPINPGINPDPLYFTVAADSPIPNGSSTLSLPTFIAHNVIFSRGGIEQTQLNTEPTYFTWNKATGEFICFPAAITSELFSINPT